MGGAALPYYSDAMTQGQLQCDEPPAAYTPPLLFISARPQLLSLYFERLCAAMISDRIYTHYLVAGTTPLKFKFESRAMSTTAQPSSISILAATRLIADVLASALSRYMRRRAFHF